MTVEFTAEQQRKFDQSRRLADRLERRVAGMEGREHQRERRVLENALEQMHVHANDRMFASIGHLKQLPVTIEEFLDSREFYRDNYEELWPQVRADLIEMNPDLFLGEPPVHEYYDGGAIGTAKSFKAKVTQAYQLYVLTCFKSPQALFGLPRSTPLVFTFMTPRENTTRRVLYEPFRQEFTSMPYVKRNVAFDRYKENVLFLDGNLQVIPALADVHAMVGQAIISAIMDEVNFMAVVLRSQKAPGAEGLGGMYDQAEIAHRTITRRRKSRFITAGVSPGCISVMSSVRYKSDFLDRRIAEAEANPSPNRKVYRRAQYEVQPASKYILPRFRVLAGTDYNATRILTDADRPGTPEQGGTYPEGAKVLDIPGEFYEDFKFDPDNALRDICGMATDSLTPFITQRHKIAEAVQRWRDAGRLSWVDKQNVELLYEGMPQINEAVLPEKRALRDRFVHIDLSKTADRCGIAIVHVAGMVNMDRGDGHVETLPYFVVDEAVSIKPSPARELDITDVRNWVMLLKSFYKFEIVCVTYDGFQSQESINAWRKMGIRSEIISMDVSTEPYDVLKSALYDDRIDLVDNELARLELTHLEIDKATGIIDHPPKSSKDVSDAIAGACYAAMTSRTIRNLINVSTSGGESLRSRTEARSRQRPSRPARRA